MPPVRNALAAPEPKVPLKEQAFQEIRGLILNGDLPAGTFMSENQLVKRLGMSKTPIRVAFERLARDGFVEIFPQRGVQVRALTRNEILDHYDLRIAIEAWAVRRVATRATADDITVLRGHVARQREIRTQVPAAPAGGTNADAVTAYVGEDAAFHHRLALLTGNTEVVNVLQMQRERLARVTAEIIQHDRTMLISSIGEHERIVSAIADQDGDRAAAEMVEHLERGKTFLDRSLALDDPPLPG